MSIEGEKQQELATAALRDLMAMPANKRVGFLMRQNVRRCACTTGLNGAPREEDTICGFHALVAENFGTELALSMIAVQRRSMN